MADAEAGCTESDGEYFSGRFRRQSPTRMMPEVDADFDTLRR